MSELDVVVEGFVATDPNQGVSKNGKPFLMVSVAHNERRKNQQSGQWENAKDGDGNDVVSWVRATFWEDEALAFAGQLTKGTLIVLRGKGRVTAYSDQQGAARGQLEILWPRVSVVLRKPSQQPQQPAGAPNGAGQAGWGQPAVNTPQNSDSNAFGGGFDDGQPF